MKSGCLPLASNPGVSDGVQQRDQPGLVVLVEVAENVAEDSVLHPWMTDAEANAPIVLAAQHLVHAAQAVVAGRAATLLDPHLAWGEIEFVVEGGDRLGRQFVEGRRLLHRLAGIVHVGQRLQREDFLARDGALGEGALEAAPPRRETVADRDDIECHEADVVAVGRHARLWIA